MALPELFADSPTPGVVAPIASLNAAVTTTPAAGTQETWTFNQGPPSVLAIPGQFHFQVGTEILLDITGGGGTSRTVLRGQEGSTTSTHAIGDSVYCFLTRGSLLSGFVAIGQMADSASQQGTQVDSLAWGQAFIPIDFDANAVGTATAGSANQSVLNVQSYIASTSSAANYEKAGILVEVATADPSNTSTPITRDAVGIDTHATILAGNMTGRAWGINPQVTIASGADGLATGVEIDINNAATADQASMDQNTSKYGLTVINIGSQNATAALYVAHTTGAGVWHKGLYSAPSHLGSGSTDSFVELFGKFVVFPTGQTVIGAGSAGFTTTLFEVQGPNATADPLVAFGNEGVSQSYSIRLGNSQGVFVWWIAGGGGSFLSDAGQGDSGIKVLTSTRAYRIGAGSTVFLVNGSGQFSFFNATPVGQASRVGQLTDSTGGTVSSTLAAGITDTVAKNAIASLAAKVNALELIVHNTGISA